MEVFFSPIKINDNNNEEKNIKFKSYQNFAFIKFYDLNILCDCPLICKNDLNLNNNQELLIDLDLDKLHEDTLFPATFLFNECNNIKENEKIEIDLILISNPYGLIGIPFLLHYNHYCNYLESSNLSSSNNNQVSINNDNCYSNQNDIDYLSDDSYSDDENFKKNYLNIYQWLNKYPCKFDITNAKLLITPPVYQSAILSLQQLIEYYSDNPFNNIIDPFIWLKTPDLYNIISSNLINNNINTDNIDSLKIRHEIFSNLPENGPEYYYNQFSFNNDNENFNNFNRITDSKNTNNELINSRGSTTGLGAAINAASHIFDGNILQNYPATIGCNTCNSNTSHPPIFGKITGEEMSYLPKIFIENQFINSMSKDINKNFILNENNNFQINIIHIGEITEICKNFSKFNIHSFDSGFCLGGVGFYISTYNMDFDIKKTRENLAIIGPISLEFDRYPASLYLGDLLNCNNLVFYGNFFNIKKSNNHDLIITDEDKQQDELKSSILPLVKIKDIDKELKIEDDVNNNNNNNIEKLNSSSIVYQIQLDNIFQHIADTLNKNGSVLIPIDCFGLLCLEIVEFIGQKISELTMPIQVPMYIIGGGISTILLNADISAEWTSQSRTRKVMLPNPNPPFLFSFLKKSNRLYAFHTLDELSTVYREPAIFFATNSNMKFGPSYDLYKTLNNNPNNTLIIIDSLVDFEKFINNFKKKPIMNIVHSPIYIEPNIYHLFENIIPYFNQNKEKFNFIIPNNNNIDSILFNNKLLKNENFIIFQNYIKLIPITNKIIYNKQNKIFGITGDWIPVTLSSDIANNTELKQISPNSFVGKAEAFLNYEEGELLIERKINNSNISNTDISEIEKNNSENEGIPKDFNPADYILLVDNIDDLFSDDLDFEYDLNNNQQIFFGSITIKNLINELKERKLDEIIVNYNDVFQEEKVISISIQSINCKIIIYSSNNFLINSNNRESRELVYEIISSLLISV
ncbi:uncharacterized protein ELE39_002805 [Cryptosporidium sp. chipmunk genotype I]|uniref:uncharacterized protein n=1 Tax=Cryptosporidium sp. chipmunk genotype I TaxID=1280935 RepID=UPI00351A2581|nr:hypothetical protein ELE39_002805 [Cryptosporidium sp. chipmunk genotype I]